MFSLKEKIKYLPKKLFLVLIKKNLKKFYLISEYTW